jgi:AcrR family transcriptional regulator
VRVIVVERRPLGLRERKKQRTRQLIADTARRLFVERGFDAVTVVEIARAADVAEKTVYNYFPTKEDLVYSRLESFETALLDAVRDRRPGESVLGAFGRFVLEPPYGLLGDGDAGERLRAISRVITDSPTLLAREQQVFARHTASLAALIAEETDARDGDLRPWVAANALMGVHRALVDYVRRRTLSGTPNATLVQDVGARGREALAALEQGLGRYGVRASG